MVAGLHVPLMAGVLVELVGKLGAVVFWQIEVICTKVGVMGLVVVMATIFGEAHCPTAGVKV